MKAFWLIVVLSCLLGIFLAIVLAGAYADPDIGRGLHPGLACVIAAILGAGGWMASGELVRSESELG